MINDTFREAASDIVWSTQATHTLASLAFNKR